MADDDLTPLHDARSNPCVGARRLLIAVGHANDEILRSAGERGGRDNSTALVVGMA